MKNFADDITFYFSQQSLIVTHLVEWKFHINLYLLTDGAEPTEDGKFASKIGYTVDTMSSGG